MRISTQECIARDGNMNAEETCTLIADCASEAQRLINELHARDPDNDTFSQAGILDGADTVVEYLAHNEFGVALDHLLYMIHESDIPYDMHRVMSLHTLAKRINIDNYYTADNLKRLGITTAYNVPPAV